MISRHCVCVWYYALISTHDVVFIYPFALRVGAADYYRCRGYGLVCAVCEAPIAVPAALGSLYGARLRLCRGYAPVCAACERRMQLLLRRLELGPVAVTLVSLVP
jgi:hypothetical protein